jgi:hypothetical protein
MAESIILVKEKLHVKQKSMANNYLNNFDSDKFEDSDDEHEHYEKKTKK